ncbi:hypothetical protein BN159_2883 [Streptomyces davaonensis JCM 4913]|uniref:Uncharacterized protein n=1 Tax=Streptomyces davaonensis (strain DSM 101723 / JCM 4913 / KCC S-0913 / 768) TaxID=1214101 RepID=K4R296_STRDJ|nr:hypothetical protein BN159_2883 [Streptomyces davaonensis JCM 4913]
MTHTQRFFCRGSGGCPPGKHSMRRLAEKPANLRFFLRSMVTKG